MRILFVTFGSISALSFLLMAASFLTETLRASHNIEISGTELTVKFSGIDRILLSVFIVSLFAAVCFWFKVSGRD